MVYGKKVGRTELDARPVIISSGVCVCCGDGEWDVHAESGSNIGAFVCGKI